MRTFKYWLSPWGLGSASFCCNFMIQKWPTLTSMSCLRVVVAICEGEEQEKRKKGPDRLWLKRKSERGAFETILRKLLAEDTASYKSFMRMVVAMFRNLAGIISLRVSKRSTVMRSPISVQHRLSFTLRYLATGESFCSLVFQFIISCPAILYIVYGVRLPKQCTYCRAIFHLFRKCELNLRGFKVKFPYLLVVVETLFDNEVNQ